MQNRGGGRGGGLGTTYFMLPTLTGRPLWLEPLHITQNSNCKQGLHNECREGQFHSVHHSAIQIADGYFHSASKRSHEICLQMLQNSGKLKCTSHLAHITSFTSHVHHITSHQASHHMISHINRGTLLRAQRILIISFMCFPWLLFLWHSKYWFI